MSNLIDLESPATQEQIAAIIGATRQAVSAIEQRGLARRGDPLGPWLVSYISNLRETAAGRAGSDPTLDLVTERARLARAQAIRVETHNRLAARELAPVHVLAEVLSRVARQIAVMLEAIPVQIKRRSNIAADDLEYIATEIVKARNLAANIRIELSDLGDDTEADDLSDDTEGQPAA